MLYPSINKIRKKADSRYTLVILAAKRARDLIDGKPALEEVDIDRPVSIAAHEIADDLLTYSRDESAMDNANDPVMDMEAEKAEAAAEISEEAPEEEPAVEEEEAPVSEEE